MSKSPWIIFIARGLLVLVACAATVGITIWKGGPFYLNTIVVFLLSSVLIFVNMHLVGHGVDKRPHTFGVTRVILCTQITLLTAAVSISWLGAGTPERSVEFYGTLSFAIFFGSIAGLIDWFGWSYKTTYYMNEELERFRLWREEYRGMSEEQKGAYIETRIKQLRATGMFGDNQQ